MTFEKILNNLTSKQITPKEAKDAICDKDMFKRINYYIHYNNISNQPMNDQQLQELNSIVNILQILYTSDVGSPIDDSSYDTLEEALVYMGIPRLTGSIEINEASKVSHKYTNLRGTLDKVYYLFPDEQRTNKHRKYLYEWIKQTEALYEKNTGRKIDLNKVKIILQPKFDGVSAIMEDGKKPLWITRGDTANNKASDVSHILNIFNDVYAEGGDGASKFEVMMTEENKDKINELYRTVHYNNSRQIVIATLNSNEADYKAEYLYPVPLRVMNPGDKIEHIHPLLIEKFPTQICTFGDLDMIKEFANKNRYVYMNGMRFRTDGAVMTILDDDIKLALGRSDRDINNFEVAYKFTEEHAYTRVKDVEFYVSDFGFITPVLVVNDVILKGNTINHISLSNIERFKELDLHYGDEVKILYDIIPYAEIDANCRRVKNGRKIEFITECPCCHEPLNLDVVQVQCTNKNCPSRIIGRVLNYCTNLRIQNIGGQTLSVLYHEGLLDNGIRSLYKLKKKTQEIEDLEGFGKLKTKKIIAEIEAKRKLKDYEFFGSIGIEGLSIKTFQTIFENIRLYEIMNMIELKNFELLKAKLVAVPGIAEKKADYFVEYLKDSKQLKELKKLIDELTLYETFGSKESTKGRVVFTGCRPNDNVRARLTELGYEPSDSWSNSAVYLVIPSSGFTSTKVDKARERNIPIITMSELSNLINSGV